MEHKHIILFITLLVGVGLGFLGHHYYCMHKESDKVAVQCYGK